MRGLPHSGSRHDKNNYRPISVLSIFSKIFEKFMFKRLYNYLERKNILYNLQFGFRANYSTSQALISIVEQMKTSLDSRSFRCGLFLDLKKAGAPALSRPWSAGLPGPGGLWGSQRGSGSKRSSVRLSPGIPWPVLSRSPAP